MFDFGSICSRGVELETDGLGTQPLPSPYAKWDVKITRGSSRLEALEVAGIKIIATFDATFNSKMTCSGEDISMYTSSLQVVAPATEADDSVALGVSVFVVIAVVALGGVFAVYRRKRTDLAQAEEEQESQEAVDQIVTRHWGKVEVAYSKLQQSVEQS